VTDHNAADPIIFALKQFDVWREICGHQIVMRKTNHRHLLVRIHFAGADPGKVFQTSNHSRFLQATQVNGRVAKYLTRRSSERPRIETVGKQVSLFSHDRHHGSKIHVEAQDAQGFAGDAAQRTRACEIAVFANRPGRRHGRKHFA
jgi:hypothetical protein